MNTHFNLFFPEEFNQERENQRLINLIVDWFETQRLYNSAFGSRNAAAPMNNTLDPADLVYQTAPDASAGHQSLVDVSPFMNAPNPADSIYQSEHHASVGHQSLVDVSPFMNTPDPNTNTSAPYMESAATVNFNSNLEAASELPVVMPPLSTADKNALSKVAQQAWQILIMGEASVIKLLPHYTTGEKPNPRIGDNGDELLTPDWLGKGSSTNGKLSKIVFQKIKLLSESDSDHVVSRATDRDIKSAVKTYFEHLRRQYREENGLVVKRSNKENGPG